MNKTKLYFLLSVTAFIICLWSCASSGELSGGEPDTEAPKIITTKSSQNESVNFKKQDIVLYFDEFVNLNKPASEIVVSPPLDYRIQPKVRGKRITFSFHEEETLVDSVTYIINFGNAIQDYRADNILKNETFVFSTGPYLDSLSISGKVYNFLDKSPMSDALIMVYTDDRDSMILRERAFYFTKSNENGLFEINNMKSDSFRIYVCSDENNNYVYDYGSESIGFLSSNVFLDSSNINNISLYASNAQPSLQLLKTKQAYNYRSDLIFNKVLDSIPPFRVLSSDNLVSNIIGDTLQLWHREITDSITIVTMQNDTIHLFPKKEKLKTNMTLSISKNSSTFVPGDSIRLESSLPLQDSLNEEFFMLTDTSGKKVKYDLVMGKNKFNVYIKPKLKYGMIYNLEVYPGFVENWFNIGFADTLIQQINCIHKDDLSTINLSISGLDSIYSNLIKVSTASRILYQKSHTTSDTLKLDFIDILPEDLNIEIVRDVNDNGKWDNANFVGRLQPEFIFKTQIKKPKPNWVIEEEISIPNPHQSGYSIKK